MRFWSCQIPSNCFFQIELYALFVFFKHRAVTFLCYDLPSLKHVIYTTSNFNCSNQAERPRFETRTCPVLFISDMTNKNTYIEMHACCFRFHQQELEPFSHFACLQDHATFSWASLQKGQRGLLRLLEISPRLPFLGKSRNAISGRTCTCALYQYSVTMSRNLNFF